MSRILLLDLDNTLFKTAAFWQDAAVAIARAAGQPDDAFVNNPEQYYIGQGKLRYFDYDAMLVRWGIDDAVVRDHLKPVAAGKNYLYDDAKQLLPELSRINDFEVAILTYGQKLFQRLKIDFTPEVEYFPAYITHELKADYIAANFSQYDRGVLVDDKPNQRLPLHWTELYINRRAKSYRLPKSTGANVTTITNLTDVVNLIR